MFEADWIIGRAGPAPDPARVRRPGLLKNALRGKPIRPQLPLPPELRNIAGPYPRDVSRLDASNAQNVLPAQLGLPNSQTWASAVATMDDPAVAIPLLLDSGIDTVRLIRAFEVDEEQLLIVAIDLERQSQGRGRATFGSIGAVTVLSDTRAGAEERMRELLERTYLASDPATRDLALRSDGREEPVVLVVAPDRTPYVDAKAVASTFGIAVDFLGENIALDERRLFQELDARRQVLAAVVMIEPSAADRLVWVNDQVRRKVAANVAVARLESQAGSVFRQALRGLLIASAAGHARVASAVTLETCRKCQPAVKRLVDEDRLAVDTIEAAAPGRCVCEGSGAENLSIRMRFALRLVAVDDLIIVGYQPNFPAALDGISATTVTHIRNAGEAQAAAQRAQLAIVVSGSQMGHSDSEPYVDALRAAGVRTLRTSGNQLSDVIRALLDEARRRRPELAADSSAARQVPTT